MLKNTMRVAALGALTVSITVTPFAAAQARSTASTTTDAPRSCVQYIGDGSAQCFGSDRAARAAAPAAKKAWVVVAYFYSKSNYGGSVLTVKAPTGCDADVKSPDWSWKAITPAWRNKVYSYVTRNKCDLLAYTGANYSGRHFAHYSDHDRVMTSFGGKVRSFRVS